MKRKFRKLAISYFMIFALLASYFTPFLDVFASDTISVLMHFEVHNSSTATMAANSEFGAVAVNTEGDGLIIYRGEGQLFVGFEDTYNNSEIMHDSILATCSTDKACDVTVTVPNDHGVRVVTPGDSPVTFLVNGNNYYGDPIANNSTVEVFDKSDNGPTPFEGKAYLFWSCGEGTCYHLFEGLSNNASFVPAATVADDTDASKKFDIMAETKGFVIKEDFENWIKDYRDFKNDNSIEWKDINPEMLTNVLDMRPYEDAAVNKGICTRNVPEDDFHACVDGYVASQGIFNKDIVLRPVNEPFSDNAYTSYGDRNFKITIYNEEFKGLTIGDLNDLNYYPSSWADGLMRIESFDISMSTLNDPFEIETVLLEPTFNIKALNAYNGFEVTAMEAVGVPEGAVTVTKDGNVYKATFSSNFYDKVKFKLTGNDGKEYYIQVNRLTLDTRDEIHFRSGEQKVNLETQFYFDRTTSYTDYVLTAKIAYKDGTSKVVELTNLKKVDDGLGNVTFAYEADHETSTYGAPGKGIKQAAYGLEFTIPEAQKIDKVYLNVEYTGTTEDSYAGAFAGSGKGVVVNFVEDSNE